MFRPTTIFAATSTGDEVEYSAGQDFIGMRAWARSVVPGADHFGEVQAWNVDTGKQVWTHHYAKSPNWGAMLVTPAAWCLAAARTIARFTRAGVEIALDACTSTGTAFVMLDLTGQLGHMIEIYEGCGDLLKFYRYVRRAAEGWDGTGPLRRLNA